MVNVQLVRIGKKEEYSLDFPYNQELVDALKQLPYNEREFSPLTKQWTIDAGALYRIFLHFVGRKDIFFQFQTDKDKEQFKKIVEKIKKRLTNKRIEFEERLKFDKHILDVKNNLPVLAKKINYSKILKENVVPYNHQLEGAYLANELNHNILVAAGLGSGKTLISLLACEINPKIEKVLIVCPNSLKLNWKNEVENFTNQKSFVMKWQNNKLAIHPKNNNLEISDCKYIIVNYDYFRDTNFKKYEKVVNLKIDNVDCIIFDEAHKLSYKNNTTHNLKESFYKKINKKILLTGTPIRSKVQNLYKLLNVIKPSEFSNQNKFLTYYCGLKYDPNNFGWVEDENNPAKFDTLHERLQTCMYRIITADVIKNLPPQVIHKVILELTDTEKKQYNETEGGFLKVDWTKRDFVKLEDGNELAIVILNRLRQLTAKFKIDYLSSFIKDLNENGEKVVVFDCFKNSLKALKDSLGENSELYTGDVSSDKRQELVDEFQDPNSRLKNLLISMNSGNAGITLTAASNLILITQSYLPDENLQAFARITRISQTKISNIFILVCDDTIDEVVYSNVIEKTRIIDKVIDGVDSFDTNKKSALSDILNDLREKYI